MNASATRRPAAHPEVESLRQQLVDTNNRIERELGRLRRMQAFNASALLTGSDDELAGRIAEALVGIFDLEFGIAWLIDADWGGVIAAAACGPAPEQAARERMGDFLATLAPPGGGTVIVDGELLADFTEDCVGSNLLLASCVSPATGECNALLLCGNTARAGGAHDALSPQIADVAALFAQQVSALVENWAGRATIERQLLEIRHAQRSLAESEARYRLMAENSSDVIWTLDAVSGRFTYISPSVRAQYGYEPDELVAADARTMLDERVQRAFGDSLARLVRALRRDGLERVTELIEVELRARDGSPVWTEAALTCIRDPLAPGGVSVLGVSRNVTERRRFEEQVRRLSLSVEQSSSCVLITSLDGRVEYVNRRFCEVSGYEREALVGGTTRFLESGETPRSVFRELRLALQQGRSWSGEFVNSRRDGTLWTQATHIVPLRDGEGRVTGYVSSGEDVTEARRIQAELDDYRGNLERLVLQRTSELERARLGAEEANRAKSQFLANMSHEIRTPLNAIIGYAHLLNEDAPTAGQRDRLQKIMGSGRHLLGLINDILDVSKIESGRMQLEDAAFQPAAVVRDVHAMMAERVAGAGLEFRVDVDPAIAQSVLVGDAMRIGQILINFVGNAVKFTARGHIAVRVSASEMDERRIGMLFEIEDTGIGISVEQQARLFQPFQQADAATTRKYGGTGLGLAISRGLVEMMGGRCGVFSEPGAGSTFWFRVTCLRGRREDLPEDAASPRAGAGTLPRVRVLLVEDNETNQEIGLELLSELGLDVEIAANGREAVEKAAAGEYALVLMDIQMPVMDGHEATRRIRATPGLEGLPVVAMTASTFREDIRDCLASGMNDFLPKPVEPKKLEGVLRRWLAGEVPEAPAAPAPAPAPVPPAGAGAGPIDFASGLSYAGGSREKLRERLAAFAARHAADAAAVRDSLAAGDRETARRTSHTLKGLAAVVGLGGVSRAAAAVEQALRAEEGGMPDADLAALERALDSACEAIRRLRPPAAAPAVHGTAGPVEPGELDALMALLAVNDLRASAAWRALEPRLRHGGAHGVDRIGQLVEAFDFEAALEALRPLRAGA